MTRHSESKSPAHTVILTLKGRRGAIRRVTHTANKKPGFPPGWRKASFARGRIEVSACFLAALTLYRGSQRGPKSLFGTPQARSLQGHASATSSHQQVLCFCRNRLSIVSAVGHSFFSQAMPDLRHTLHTKAQPARLSTPKGAWEFGPTLLSSIKESI